MNPEPNSPLFILSTERSGSTLLRYILDTHPDICCPGELFLGQLAFALHTTISRTTALARSNEPKEIHPFTWTEVNRLITEQLSKFTRSRGKKLWCDKTPANVLNLMELQQAFPNARYICLHRNSLDVVHSCLEIRQKVKPNDQYTPFESKYPELILSYMLERWVQHTEIMVDFEAGYPQAHRIRYEDLVSDPVKTLDPLFRFLGLPWDPSLLDRVFSVAHDQGGGDDKILRTKGIEKGNIGKGATLDRTLLAKIQPVILQRQKKLHQALGYPES